MTECTRTDREQALMLRVANGDLGAFETLVDRFQGGLIQYFTMLTRDRSIAEDLAQEVFLKLYRSRQRYRPEAKFQTYLYRIARNHWTDHLRRQTKRGKLVPLEDQNEPPGDPAITTIEWQILERAVASLSEKQRHVFLLSRIEDLSFPEISQILEIPVGTVKSRMHHALSILREALSPSGGRYHA